MKDARQARLESGTISMNNLLLLFGQEPEHGQLWLLSIQAVFSASVALTMGVAGNYLSAEPGRRGITRVEAGDILTIC